MGFPTKISGDLLGSVRVDLRCTALKSMSGPRSSLLLFACYASQQPGKKSFALSFYHETFTLEPLNYGLNSFRPWAKMNLSFFRLWVSDLCPAKGKMKYSKPEFHPQCGCFQVSEAGNPSKQAEWFKRCPKFQIWFHGKLMGLWQSLECQFSLCSSCQECVVPQGAQSSRTSPKVQTTVHKLCVLTQCCLSKS